jgi:hypothetical protein
MSNPVMFSRYDFECCCKDIRFNIKNSEVSYDELMKAVPAWRGMSLEDYDHRCKVYAARLLKSRMEKRYWLNILIEEKGSKDQAIQYIMTRNLQKREWFNNKRRKRK